MDCGMKVSIREFVTMSSQWLPNHYMAITANRIIE
jgi:hypothetical protein